MDEVAKMELLRDMKDTEGWKLVDTYISDRIKDHTNQLITCPIEAIEKHRQRIEAYKSVLLYVEDEIEKGMVSIHDPM